MFTVFIDFCHIDCDDDGNVMSQYWDASSDSFDNEYDAYLYAHHILSDGHRAVIDGYVNGGIDTRVYPR